VSAFHAASLATAAAFVAAAVALGGPTDTHAPVAALHTDRSVALTHLDAAQRAALLDAPSEARLFLDGQTTGAGLGALRATAHGGAVHLAFRFPLAAGTHYDLHHPALAVPLDVAGPPHTPSPPSVLRFVPDANELPSNLLRVYVEFSEPMSEKFAMSKAIEVVDLASGQLVDAALLDVERPLFDADNRRLTVVFNPGRTKRGVGSNLEGGPPLAPGGTYALRVVGGLEDAQGDALPGDVMHVFRTVAPTREPLDLGTWQVDTPAPGSADPLEIHFDRWLDPYQAQDRIVLLDDAGARVAVTADSTGHRLTLRPAAPWTSGCYELVASPELEDVSGNRPTRAFDAQGRGEAVPHRRAVDLGGC
jgi:hypothetical protein